MQPQTLVLILALPALYTTEDSSSLLKCGKPVIAPDESAFSGGREAAQHSWPWVVAIRHDSHNCSGSIVNESWVATAAECVKFSEPALHSVEAGRHCHNCDEANVQRRQVDKILIHPEFETNYTEHDLALLRVSEPFQYSENVSQICLPTQPLEDSASCFVTGWGGTGAIRKDKLHQAQLPIVPNLVCGDPDHYGNDGISKNMVCAGYDKAGVNFCSGDYGSPLACKAADSGLWQLHGIMSAGDSCDNPRRPLVFTRVHKYLSWIQLDHSHS